MSLLPLHAAGAIARPLAGQTLRPGGTPRETALHAYALKHQKASEAVALVHPLLSPRGSVELQPGSNTLVIRDTPAALARILPVLRGFDHPTRPLQLEMLVVRASRVTTSPRVTHSDLPEELTERLRQMLPYDIYELEARADLASREGEDVTFSLGDEYQVGFRMGTLLADGRIKLSDFRVDRRTPKRANLIHIHLNLWLDKTMSLGLARSEESREALIVVMTLRAGSERAAAPRAGRNR